MAELTAADIMSASVISVAPETPLRAIARLLDEHGISGVPVVEDDGRIAGIISETDLIDPERRRAALPRIALFGVITLPDRALREAFDEGNSLAARDLMTRRVFTLPEETPAREVAAEMVARRINRIPIVRDGRLAGIVARADVLRAILSNWEKPEDG